MKTKKRFLSIDLLRGFFIFVIIIDHLSRYPGIYEIFTGKAWLFVSAAEGFFLISGLMFGYIRGHKAKDKPMLEVLKSSWKRSFVLYLTTVLISISLVQLHIWVKGYQWDVHDLGWSTVITNILTLKRVYGWTDFLPYYAAFLAVSPLAIYLLRKKKAVVVAVLSIIVWAWGRELEPYYRWQILFFSGVIAGFYMPNIQAWFENLTQQKRRNIKVSVYISALITLILSVFISHFSWKVNWGEYGYINDFLHDINVDWFTKTNMPLARVLMSYLWFIAAIFLVTDYEEKINNAVGGLLIPLGRDSLFSYASHAFFLYFINMNIDSGTEFTCNVTITTSVVLGVWFVSKLNLMWKKQF